MVQLFLLMFYFVLGNVYWTFFSEAVIRLFEILKMFYLRVDGMGWDGMGWDGMGYQKCPSIFFILCVYIDHICNLLYM